MTLLQLQLVVVSLFFVTNFYVHCDVPINIHAKTIEKLITYFNSQCVFILTSLKTNTGLKLAIDLQKSIVMMNHVSVSVTVLQTKHREAFEALVQCHRPLCVLPFDIRDENSSMLDISNQYNMASAVWLQILDPSTSVEEFYTGIDIPFNCEMLVVQKVQQTVHLIEVYRKRANLPLQMNVFGSMTEKGELSATRLGLNERRKDLRGVVMRAVLLHDPPYVSINRKGNTIEVNGFVGETFKALKDHLHFTTDFVVSTDKIWGNLFPNGSWNGMVGMINRKDVDMSINAFTFTVQRSSVLDYTVPLVTKDYNVFIKMPSKTAFTWSRFLAPFSPTLWLVTFVAMIAIGFLLSRLNRVERGYRNDASIPIRGNISNTVDAIYCVFSVFLQQGQDAIFDASSCQIALLTALLVSTVIRAAYSGVVISFIAVHTVALPFRDVREMLDEGSYKVGAFGVPMEFRIFNDTKGSDILLQLSAKIKEEDDYAPKSLLEGLDRVCDNKYALLTSLDAVMSHMSNISCKIVPLPGVSFKAASALPLAKNCPYRSLFNHVLHKLINIGVLKKLRLDVFKRQLTEVEVTINEANLEDIAPILVLVLCGILLGLLLLMIECYCHKVKLLRLKTLGSHQS